MLTYYKIRHFPISIRDNRIRNYETLFSADAFPICRIRVAASSEFTNDSRYATNDGSCCERTKANIATGATAKEI